MRLRSEGDLASKRAIQVAFYVGRLLVNIQILQIGLFEIFISIGPWSLNPRSGFFWIRGYIICQNSLLCIQDGLNDSLQSIQEQ